MTKLLGNDSDHHGFVYSPVVGDTDDKGAMGGYPMSDGSIHPSHLNKTEKLTSLSGCYFTLANTIMGAGTLGLPFALSNTGYVMGSILLCLSGLASSFALHCLSLCALKLPYPSSFYAVASTALPNFEKLIDLAVVIKCFGVATSYLIVIGGLMPDAMTDVYGSTTGHGKSFFTSRFLWVTVGFIMVIPLSFFKNLGALRYTSFFSIMFLCFLALIVVLFANNVPGLDPCHSDDDGNEECVGERVNIKFDLNTMRVFSIFIFGFTCHQNMFTIVNELQSVNIQRCNTVIGAAICSAVTVYLIIANCGYYTYGDNVESNILQSYPSKCFILCDLVYGHLDIKITAYLQRCQLSVLPECLFPF